MLRINITDSSNVELFKFLMLKAWDSGVCSKIQLRKPIETSADCIEVESAEFEISDEKLVTELVLKFNLEDYIV